MSSLPPTGCQNIPCMTYLPSGIMRSYRVTCAAWPSSVQHFALHHHVTSSPPCTRDLTWTYLGIYMHWPSKSWPQPRTQVTYKSLPSAICLQMWPSTLHTKLYLWPSSSTSLLPAFPHLLSLVLPSIPFLSHLPSLFLSLSPHPSPTLSFPSPCRALSLPSFSSSCPTHTLTSSWSPSQGREAASHL